MTDETDTQDIDVSQTKTGKTETQPNNPQKNIRVFKLKIMLNLNIPGMTNPTPFQFNMLSHPDLEKGKFSASKYTLPYFTDTVKYPMEMLTPKMYSDRVDFFFNKTRFNKILRKTMVDYVEEEQNEEDDVDKLDENMMKERKQREEERSRQLQDNADHNIKCMLILLFPIADELGNVFKTSYDQYILNKPSPELYTIRNIDPVTFLNPSWFPIYNYFAERTYEAPINEISYLNINSTKYIVADVIWQNDLINHPVYREFVSVYYDKLQEKRNNRRKIMAEFRERKEMFKTLFGKYIEYDTKTKSSVFASMIQILIQNVSGQHPERNPNRKYELTPMSSTSFNQKENAKRDIITKMINYLGSLDDIIRGYDGELSGSGSPTRPITKDNIYKELRGVDGEYILDKIIDNILNTYIDYTNYNKSAEGSMKLTLKDTTRILTELYNVAVLLKTLKLLVDFVTDAIRRLDLSEKNDDGSTKTKLEVDIIRVLKSNYTYYVDLNTSITSSLKDVVDPARRSANPKLQSFLKQLAVPGQATPEDPNMLIDIYDKYISSIRSHIKRDYIEKYMNVGVSTVQSASTAESASSNKSDNLFSGEMPEIYVYINVVKKDNYEKNDGRQCIMNDDRIANNLKQVLYSNTMMDNSFPELNVYRDYRFLGKNDSEETNEKPSTETNDEPSNYTETFDEPPRYKKEKGEEIDGGIDGGKYGGKYGGKRRTRKYTRPQIRRTRRRITHILRRR
jgi:hypothetical protein